MSQQTQRGPEELVDLLLSRAREVAQTLARELAQLVYERVSRVPDALLRSDPVRPTRPTPFHQLLDEDDLAIIAEDRKHDGDLAARGVAEAWLA